MSRNGKNNKGGRPVGSKTQATLEKEAVNKAIKQKILNSADILYASQLSLAKGNSFLYVIRSVKLGAKIVKQKPELIEDQATIEKFLNDELNHDSEEYYYISTKDPDNRAIDSMFDRVFGKATQAIEVGGKDGEPIKVTVMNYGDNSAPRVQP